MAYVEVIKPQQKLADILCVNQTTVSKWLLGKKSPATITFCFFMKSLVLNQIKCTVLNSLAHFVGYTNKR